MIEPVEVVAAKPESKRCRNCRQLICKDNSGDWVHVNRDDADVCNNNGNYSDPEVAHVSERQYPECTEPCPVCGAVRKPGDVCASCGQARVQSFDEWFKANFASLLEKYEQSPGFTKEYIFARASWQAALASVAAPQKEK